MIGDNFWSVGIIISWRRYNNVNGEWNAKVEFFDNGICEDGSTRGVLSSRYYESNLDKVIDIIKADAEKLGIEFKVIDGLSPYIFMEGDGEIKGKNYPENWKKIINDQAIRIGWKPVYKQKEVKKP